MKMGTRKLRRVALAVIVVFSICSIVVAGPAFAKERISIGTGGSGGVFYVLGAGMAKIINDTSKNLLASAQSTAATTENINLTNKRGLDFSFVVLSSAYEGVTATGAFTGKKKEDIRLVMYGHLGLFAPVALKKSGIETMVQAKGKRVAMSPGSLGKQLTVEAFAGSGLQLSDFSSAPVLSYSEMVNALKDGTIDVGGIHAAHPTSAILDIAALHDIRILSQTEESTKKIMERNPAWLPAEIPAGTYRGVDYEVKTFATPYAIIVNKDVSEAVVYEFIKTIMENNKDLVAVHSAGAFYTKTNIGYKYKPVVPFHPAAAKYLKEIGAIK
ncbi:MAG: TAXI family TRAP transporter solute-binding subunit [Deltaproteobacteria bacterium]|nr:TAXI family TRAP transporter solute-binding subunit [Deltaproteobacteria bacterium]